MEKTKGIIRMQDIRTGSKSDGKKAYLIDESFKHYQLYRKGSYEINDEYFFPYHLKEVVVSGKIEKQKWIQVDNIELVNILHDTPSKRDYNFKKSEDFPDIINSEGAILCIVEEIYDDDGSENERLWLRGLTADNIYVYVRVNETALQMFFQGRISVRELFLLRNDEDYVIEEDIEERKVQSRQYYSEKFDEKYLMKIACADLNYHSIPKEMRLDNPMEDIMKKLELFWINSHMSQQTSSKH